MLFVFILVSLILPVCRSKAGPGSSAVKETCQQNNFCITLSEGVLTAEAGLCVVIPCSFTTDSTYTPTNIIWSKCKTPNPRCDYSDVIFSYNYPRKVGQSGFEGRVSLLEPDVNQRNCSIIINDLKKTDSGSYQLRLYGFWSNRVANWMQYYSRANVSVKDLTQKPTVMVPPLTEGQQTTLSCTAPGRCPGSPPQITWTWRGRRETESQITGNVTDVKTENLSHTSSLTFTPSAEHHGTKIICKVSFKNRISKEETKTLSVTYLKAPIIRGHGAVKLGAALHLTCSVDSFPPSVVTWTKLGSNKTLKENTRTAKLIIPYMTAEDVGKFICSASQQITKQTARTEVNVTMKPSILNSSACEVQSEVLTCVCISQGFPLPTIEWPMLKKRTHYSLTTSVINNTINTNISVSVRDLSYTTVVCVSRGEVEEVKKELKVVVKNVTKSESEEEEEPPLNLLENIKQPQVIIAFLIGVLLSAAVCCSVQKCHRKKQKSSGNMSLENLEMMDVDPALVNGGSYGQHRPEGGAEAEDEADEELREVEYSNINFDLLKRGRPVGAERGLKTTEYAEIKTAKTESVQDIDGEMMEGNQEEERNDYVIETEEEEEERLYSNVEDLMKEV